MTAAASGMPKPSPSPNPTRRLLCEEPWFIKLLGVGELVAGGELGTEVWRVLDVEAAGELNTEVEAEVGSNFTP
jgi:hypothetical protein